MEHDSRSLLWRQPLVGAVVVWMCMTRCWVSEASDAVPPGGGVELVGFWLFDFFIVDASILKCLFRDDCFVCSLMVCSTVLLMAR